MKTHNNKSSASKKNALNLVISERIDDFQRYRTQHPSLNRVLDSTSQIIGITAEPRVVLITGPSGVGKTVFARRLRKFLADKFEQKMQADSGLVPVMWANAMSPMGRAFSWKDFYIRLLRVHDNVLLDHKMLVPGQREMFPDDPRHSHLDRSVADALRRQAEECIRRRKTTYLIIDEAQHMLMNMAREMLEFQFEAIKSLSVATNLTIILIGTYPLLQIRDMSGQLVRRSQLVHFPRYDINNQTDKAGFKSALLSLQRELPFERPVDLSPYLSLLYSKSVGCVGILKEWLDRSISYCHGEHCELTGKVLEATALSNKALLTILEEAMEGEEAMRDLPDKDLDQVLAKGFDGKFVRSGLRAAGPTGTRNRYSRVGTRNPVRDPAGGVHAKS